MLSSWYLLESLKPEKKIHAKYQKNSKYENGGNVPSFDEFAVVFVHCNFVNNK